MKTYDKYNGYRHKSMEAKIERKDNYENTLYRM